MEDASGVDLDWFWRGWFYTNDHCDVGMKEVNWFQVDTKNPEVEQPLSKNSDDGEPMDISTKRDKDFIKQTRLEKDPSLHDYYTQRDEYAVTLLDKQEYEEYIAELEDEQRSVLDNSRNFYEITFENIGGLVMPLIIGLEYEDGTEEVRHIPAEIWKMGDTEVTKVFLTEKPVAQISLDPYLETADCDISNNYWPPKPTPSRFEIFKDREGGRRGGGGENPMQRDQRNQELKKDLGGTR
jgi:hypothetical protein